MSIESTTPADELRATTKWIVAGAIALGSALIALLPSLFPTGKDLGETRVAVVLFGAGLAAFSIAAIVFASARVLGPRPNTVRDLVHYLDSRSKERATHTLIEDLNRSRRELLPAGTSSVRQFWFAMSREQLSAQEVSTYAPRILQYADGELTGHYFRSLIRFLGLWGPLAAAGVFVTTAALTTAPAKLQMEWRDSPIAATVAVPANRIPAACDLEGSIDGAIVAVSSDDSRFLFVTTETDACPAFGVLLDATRSAPSVRAEKGG
jgi:hypothetical protein